MKKPASILDIIEQAKAIRSNDTAARAKVIESLPRDQLVSVTMELATQLRAAEIRIEDLERRLKELGTIADQFRITSKAMRDELDRLTVHFGAGTVIENLVLCGGPLEEFSPWHPQREKGENDEGEN